MSAPKFEHGPWAVRPDIGTPVGTLKIAHPEWPRGLSDPLIAAVYGTAAEQQSRAYLIAAAPLQNEALVACRVLLSEWLVEGSLQVASVERTIAAVDAALAKAVPH